MLLAVGLVVFGPNKLPAAARNLAHGLSKARHLAASLTDPLTTSLVEPVKASVAAPLRTGLAEPRRTFDDAIAGLRSTIAEHPLSNPADQQPADPSIN